MSTQTATILVTDLVASTELRARVGEEVAERLRRVHDSLLRAAVEGSGGRVVKGLGDGVLASFAGAADALAAAIAIQRGIARHRRRHPAHPLWVRIGVSSGDVSVEDGDVFGTPVIEASRLCAAAEGGAILAADLVALLARGRGGHRFSPAGDLVLKGLPHPMSTVHVGWDDDGESAVPLPASLATEVPLRLVGRETELGRLRDAWKLTLSTGRRVVLLAGEPGVGKTRLVRELAVEAHGEGAIVLLGRCDDAVPAPLRPVAEICRHAAQHAPDVLAALPAAQQAVLERLLAADRATPQAGADPVGEALERHEAVDALLAGLAEQAPVIVVLDDLHWADPATLLLLRHLASEPSAAEVLVVGTFRDTDLDDDHPLADTLAALRRAPATDRVALRGLDETGTAALVAAWAGDEAPEAFVAAVFAETEGNPFFVGEVLQHLAETGAVHRGPGGGWTTDRPVTELGIPEGVRETVGRRLQHLGKAAMDVLSVAAVAGRQFDVDVVAEAGGVSESAAVEALEPALRRGLVVEGDGFGRFEFSHALVRSTLLEQLVTLRRIRLHQRIGSSIERLHADRLVEHADALAHHFGEAAGAGEWDRAVRYHVLAAERAEGLGDPAGAETHLVDALEIHDRSGVDDPGRELDLVVRLAWALGAVGKAAPARVQFDRGMAIAMRTGDPEHMVSALRPAAWLAQPGTDNADLLAPVQALLRVLPEGDSLPRAAALTMLAFLRSNSMVSRADFEETLSTAEEAVAMAERVGSIAEVTGALNPLSNCLLSLWEPQRALDVIRRIQGAASTIPVTNRRATMTWLSFREATALLQLGERDERDRLLERLRADRAVTSMAFPAAFLEQLGFVVAMAEGRLDDAEAHLEAALAMAPGEPNVASSVYAQRCILGVERDSIDPSRLDAMVAVMPNPWIEAVAALLRAQRGDVDAASAALDAFARREDVGIPFNMMQTPTLRALAETTGHVGDAAFAEALTPYVSPYRGQLFSAGYGLACEGAADRALGQLALARGDHDTAVADLEAARAMEERFRAPALTARTQYWLARALWARGAPGDDERAERELTVAAQTADDLGLPSIRHLIERLDGSARRQRHAGSEVER